MLKKGQCVVRKQITKIHIMTRSQFVPLSSWIKTLVVCFFLDQHFLFCVSRSFSPIACSSTCQLKKRHKCNTQSENQDSIQNYPLVYFCTLVCILLHFALLVICYDILPDCLCLTSVYYNLENCICFTESIYTSFSECFCVSFHHDFF